MTSRRILVVEDDTSIRQTLRTVLEAEGHVVLSAANGRDGIGLLTGGQPPDLILLDMMMPVMNGWDFLDFMRANAATAGIPVIVVSAYEEIAKSVHPDGFLSKPIQLKALLRTIEKVAA